MTPNLSDSLLLLGSSSKAKGVSTTCLPNYISEIYHQFSLLLSVCSQGGAADTRLNSGFEFHLSLYLRQHSDTCYKTKTKPKLLWPVFPMTS